MPARPSGVTPCQHGACDPSLRHLSRVDGWRGGGRFGELLLPAAFAISPVPQSVPWLRFQSPLVEPDVRNYRIRLSDKVLRFRPRKVASPLSQSYQPQLFVQVLVRELPCSLAA